MMGAIILHGGHHSAKKSINTGVFDCNTSASKVPSDTCLTWLIDPPALQRGRRAGSSRLRFSALEGCDEVGGRRAGDRRHGGERYQLPALGPELRAAGLRLFER